MGRAPGNGPGVIRKLEGARTDWFEGVILHGAHRIFGQANLADMDNPKGVDDNRICCRLKLLVRKNDAELRKGLKKPSPRRGRQSKWITS